MSSFESDVSETDKDLEWSIVGMIPSIGITVAVTEIEALSESVACAIDADNNRQIMRIIDLFSFIVYVGFRHA